MTDMTLKSRIEDFLVNESRLLDAQAWDAWNALFTDDGIYWMPASPGQTDARQHVSLMYENALLREVRLQRFKDQNAFSLQPHPRGWRMIANLRIEPESADGAIVVTGRLHATEYRREVSVFHAFVTWHLVESGDGFRIRLKRVELLNCDGELGDINLYL